MNDTYTPDDQSEYFVGSGIVTDESDIVNCVHCGWTVMPWMIDCPACGKNHRVKEPEYGCPVCGDRHHEAEDAQNCCLSEDDEPWD